jgi:hypothetical protein
MHKISEILSPVTSHDLRFINYTISIDKCFSKFSSFCHRSRLPTAVWVTIENAERLATTLMIDPCWLFENLDLWASEARRRRLVGQLAEHVARKTPSKAPSGTAADKETVRAILANHPSIEKHPAQRKPNAKIDGYRVAGGLAFAHQHEGKTQFLWIPDDISVPESAIVKHYPAVGSDEASTRHSGLAKFPELGRSAVNKVKLKDSNAFNEILDRLVASSVEFRQPTV